jgi:cephalosporin-C deacetylase
MAETACTTLAYFDGMNLATRANAPALYSTALMDDICPPSTVFAAYNHLPVENKRISVYEFNGHNGGGPDHLRVKRAYLRELWG